MKLFFDNIKNNQQEEMSDPHAKAYSDDFIDLSKNVFNSKVKIFKYYTSKKPGFYDQVIFFGGAHKQYDTK